MLVYTMTIQCLARCGIDGDLEIHKRGSVGISESVHTLSVLGPIPSVSCLLGNAVCRRYPNSRVAAGISLPTIFGASLCDWYQWTSTDGWSEHPGQMVEATGRHVDPHFRHKAAYVRPRTTRRLKTIIHKVQVIQWAQAYCHHDATI